VPLWLNHQGNHAHRHAPAEPAPSHPTRSIGSPPATTSACSVDPQAGAVGAVAGPIQLRRSHSPYPTRGQESGARQSWSTARCASRLLWAADHVPGHGPRPARAHVQARWPVRPLHGRRSLARAFLRPSRVLRRSARARSPTRTHPPSPSLKPCAVGLSALRRPAAQGGAGRGQLSFTDLGTPLHPPRPELEALPSWM
jgi:hypothetical protein